MKVSRWWWVGRIGVATILLASAVGIGQTLAGSGDWASDPETVRTLVAVEKILHPQPRPASAPTAPDGHAIELIGTIEQCPLPRQPRPLSAAPNRLDEISASLTE